MKIFACLRDERIWMESPWTDEQDAAIAAAADVLYGQKPHTAPVSGAIVLTTTLNGQVNIWDVHVTATRRNDRVDKFPTHVALNLATATELLFSGTAKP